MGKDQELLQAVKTEDLLTVQKLLQRPRPGKASCLPLQGPNCEYDWEPDGMMGRERERKRKRGGVHVYQKR
ncbi:hypothetical protein ATANTOWER_021330 [Ataeniobius toweri]|uniref:Uncharacterized protein n=1 Tax=Ataeniobius toweri TaxID=208326 RepID=A0ABU7A388_9TELE|nr:hypothetical protein [Ataeniobius toweri]